MTQQGFAAAPADFAAAAPRLAEAADRLSAAGVAAVAALAGLGPFWGADDEFAHAYRGDAREVAKLAAHCEQALRAMAEQLAGAGAAYAAADAAAAAGLRAVAVPR